MFAHSTPNSTTPTPGSSSSSNNTLEPVTNTSTNSSSYSQLHQQNNSSLSASASSSSTQSYAQQQQQQPHLLHQQQQQQQQQQQHHLQHAQHQISNLNSRPPSRAPSILDSPTLARVERARLRLEASTAQQPKQHLLAPQQQQLQHLQQQQQHHYHRSFNGSCGSGINSLSRDDSLERSILDPKQRDAPWHQVWTHMKRLSHASKVNSTTTLCAPQTDLTTPAGKALLFSDRTGSLKNSLHVEQVFMRPDMQSLLAGRMPVASMTGPIKRGLLWQQRDRLFSRWKERYFVLTRDYLHCFKRASGSANERASDMGQFIFKIKLVDVEKVEWLNRRSYSVIGLLLGREGRVLLRCDEGLEDWFELLEECTITSKQRRHALKITQSPRSRASLAAPISHATLQSNNFGMGGNYSNALDDWLMSHRNGLNAGRSSKLTNNSISGYNGTNPFLFSDSVPDLSALNNENHNHGRIMSSNHSTPMKIPYSSNGNGNSRYMHGHSVTSHNVTYANCNGGMFGSPRRIFINSNCGSTQRVDEEAGEEGEVELRRPRIFRQMSGEENGNEMERNGLYRKPRPPTDMRHSAQPVIPVRSQTSSSKLITDLDYSGHDSGLDTPPSTANRPSSYRRQPQDLNGSGNHHNNDGSSRDSSETSASSSRGTMLNSPVGSFRAKQLHHLSNLNRVNDLHGSRQSVQERILKIRNEEEHNNSLIRAQNRLNGHHHHHGEMYDANLNPSYRNGNHSPRTSLTPQHTPVKTRHLHPHGALNGYGNNNGSLNSNMRNGSAIFRERCQHPAVAAIMNGA